MDTIAQPEPYGVYVLKCEQPKSVETHERRAINLKGYPPKHIYKAMNSWAIYYVGMSNNLHRRFSEHLEGGERAAEFLRIFKPISLVEVNWYQNKDKALKAEEFKAVEMRNSPEDIFVWQR